MTILDVHFQTLAKFSAAEIELLEKIHGRLELAGDISYAQVSLYVRAGRAKKLILVGQARSRNVFSVHRTGLDGMVFAASEEPLVWRTLETGEPITGQREWALGMEPLFMETFPVKTAKGKVIAVLSFELSGEETGADHQILLETVYMLLVSDYDPQQQFVYRPLFSQDGILAVNERGQIIYANAAAAGIYRVLGVGRLVGRRVHERALSFRLAHKACDYRTASGDGSRSWRLVLSEKAVPWSKREKLFGCFCLSLMSPSCEKKKELMVKSAVIQGFITG